MVDQQFYRNDVGHLHREDGPAFVFPSGTEMWYRNNKRHRTDGPAVVRTPFNSGSDEFWVDGVHYTDILVYWLAVTEWKKTNANE